MFCFQIKIIACFISYVVFCHPKLFLKMLFGQRYLLVYNRFIKISLTWEASAEGAIKKIIFSISISLYSYLNTIGWEPWFDEKFLKENPSRWERSVRQCFYKTPVAGSKGRILWKTRSAGSIRRVCENPSCWEQSEVEMFWKTKYCPSGRPNN